MPDFGLGRAIVKAVSEGAKDAKVLRPAEQIAAEQAVKDVGRAKVPPATEPTMAPIPVSDVPTPEVAIEDPQISTIERKPPPVAPAAVPPESVQPPPAAAEPQATRLSKANLGDYALDETHQPNFDKITTTDGVKAVIADLAEQNKVRIEEARRGTITNDQLQGLASDLDVDKDVVQQVLQRENGGTLSPEVTLAARQVLNSSAERIKTLADKIADGQGSDIEKVQFARQIQFHNDYQAQFMGARAEAGRALNAFSIPVGADANTAKRIGEIIANTGGDIDRLAQAIKLTDSVSGVTEIARGGLFRRAAGATLNFINRNFVNGILSGPPTHMVNMMGNAIFQAMNSVELALAARLGRFLPGDEHVLAGEALSNLAGTLGATKDAFRLAWRAAKSGQSLDGLTKVGGAGDRTTLTYLPELNTPYLGRMISGIDQFIGLPTRLLGAEDDFSKTLAYRADLQRQTLLHIQEQIGSGQMKLEDAAQEAKNFMENPPEEAQQAAEAWAQDMTFQTPLGPSGQKFQSALRSVPVLTLIAPFVRTPVNIFKQAAYRGPMAVFTSRFWSDVSKGGRARDLALTRFAVGSGTAAVVAEMVANGNLTGGGPQKGDARMLWQENGRRPYSLRITNPLTGEVTWHSYARMEPVASVVGAVADTVEILSHIESDADTMTDDQSQAYQAAGSVVAGIMNNTGNKTFMKGISDFVELMNDPGRTIQSYSNQFVASQVPYSALQRFVRNTQDPYLREAWTLTDKIRDNTPGLSKDLPLRLDLFGQPREKNSSTLMGTMTPIPESPEKYDNVVRELTDVMQQTRTVPVTMPDKRIDGMRLTAAEYADFVRVARSAPILGNRTFHEQLDRIMNSSVYQGATPTLRAELLKHAQSQADSAGKVQLEKDNPEFAERIASWRMQQNRLKFGQ